MKDRGEPKYRFYDEHLENLFFIITNESKIRSYLLNLLCDNHENKLAQINSLASIDSLTRLKTSFMQTIDGLVDLI